MAAWTLTLLLLAAPGLDTELQDALERSGVSRSGLGAAAGEAGAPPVWTVAPDDPRIPASNQKVLTAAAAIQALGADYKFKTRIARSENGDVVVIGEGDPNFSGRLFGGDPTRILRVMAKDVREKGITTIRTLVLDAGRFDDEYVHPDWPEDQLERWYCAPVAALLYNDSCWDVRVLPGPNAGSAARVEVQPSLLVPPLDNQCETVDAGARHVVHIARGAERELEIRGQIVRTSQGIEGNVAVRDPVLFFGRAFRAALEAEGVAVGAMRRGGLPGAKDLLVYRSSLSGTIDVMLRRSQNLYAECLFKRLGEGSFASGGEALAKALRELGVDTEGLDARDGSGLARTNRVTPRTLYETLQAMREEPSFVNGLAIGGEGTLRRRYQDLGARVHLKTGTIRGVTTLSGYVTGREGGRYVFTILANGSSVRRARRLQDLIVTTLAARP